MKYISIDRVLNKFQRDLKGTEINETDAIEWIGEALEFLQVYGSQEEVVAFVEVKDYSIELPKNLQTILQIARDNSWTSQKQTCIKDICDKKQEGVNRVSCPTDHPANIAGYPIPLDCNGKPITDYDVAYYRPYFDLKWEYEGWNNSSYRTEQYTPIRLANNIFFKSIVCKERDMEIYNSCQDEYTIVGNEDRKIKFSFAEGAIAISYLRSKISEDTGYPLIPENPSYMAAITYYLKWKISEWHLWSGREGYVGIAQDSERKWLKYARQAKNYMKMPKSIDDYQNLLDQSHYLIPNHKRYYGFFGNLAVPENRNFNNPHSYGRN